LGCLNIHFCQVAVHPAAWQYPWHLPSLGAHCPQGCEAIGQTRLTGTAK
jgi:hypothetical protein